jgi:hypothetical protein
MATMLESPLSQEQQDEMLRVIFPDDRWPAWLRPTAEIEAAYREWLSTGCSHKDVDLRRVPIKGGNFFFGRRCLKCGERSGNWIPRKELANPDAIPLADEMTPFEFDRQRRQRWQAVQVAFYEKQHSKVTAEYEAYLQSAAWKSLREKVIARANGICEGCLEKSAVQVHHVSYEHRFEEFCWELVAICNDCHVRAHPEKHGKIVGDD